MLSVSLLATAVAGNDIIVHLEDRGYILESPPDITADAAVLLNMRTGEVIYEKNGSRAVYPASAVKIMTAIVAVEHIWDASNNVSLDTQVVTSHNAAHNALGRRIGMIAGEVFTVEDLLNLILVHGANDACLAIAELVSGNESAFVAKMNARARELGALNTVFMNSTGIHHAEMVTTALDMAKISLHASAIPLIMEITSAPNYEIPPTNMRAGSLNLLNRNHFVSRAQNSRHFYEGARGLNAGGTDEAGNILITVAEQPNNLAYLCVIMGATSTYFAALGAYVANSFDDARKLLDWAFAIYSYRTVLRRREHILTVGVELAANNDEITLVPEEDINLLLPRSVNIDEEISRIIRFHEESLFAPIQQGQVLGEVALMYRGEVVASTNLLAASDVELSNVLSILDRIRNIVARPWFAASVIIFLILLAGYIGLALMRRTRRERKRFY